MKILTEVIIGCLHCPYRRYNWETDEGHFCAKIETDTRSLNTSDFSNPEYIPEWCPLDEYEYPTA